jgi:hypothetical protein
MPATTSSLLDHLTGAISLSTAALEEEADVEVRRAAMRSLHRALGKVAGSDEIWTDLADRAARVHDAPDLDRVNARLDVVADVLVERYAVLLVAGGYTSPPPPRAHELLSRTRRALLSDPAPQPLDRLANARAGLRSFVQVVSAHPNPQNRWHQQRVLRGGRKAAAASLLLPLVWATEIRSGAEFDVSSGFGPVDGASTGITVPGPPVLSGAVAGRIASSGAQHLERALEEARSAVMSGSRIAAQFAVDQRTRSEERTDGRIDEKSSSEWHPTWEEGPSGKEQGNGRGHGTWS